MAGPEFAANALPGKLGIDYKFPTDTQLKYYKDAGFKAIRIPILWERLQPAIYSGLNISYLSHIKSVLERSNKLDLKVTIDLHNYGRYRGIVVGSTKVPNSALYDFWRKLALEIVNQPALQAYGLMNEPNGPAGSWHASAQHALNGVRSVDKTRYVLVSGEAYSNSERWSKINPTPFVIDPSGLEIYEAHLYLDADTSGKYANTNPPSDPELLTYKRLSPFLEWLNRYGKRGAIGEWGVPTNDTKWLGAAKAVTQTSRNYCMPFFVWAGGAWSPNYLLSLEPSGGTDKILMSTLKQLIK